MIAHIVTLITLVVFYILQTAIFSQMRMVAGTADLILLFFAAWSLNERNRNIWLWAGIAGFLISLVSAMPFYAPLVGYLGVVAISGLIRRRIWRSPVLAMFVITLLGTVFQQLVYVIALQVSGAPISWTASLDSVILPSMLLNLIFALPIYAVIDDLMGRVYAQETE